MKTTLSILFMALASSAMTVTAAHGAEMLREDFDDPAAPKPFTGDSTRLESSIDKGVLRIADKGTQRGDMVTWRRAWCADPADGATVNARVKVLNCTGLAGVMVGFSDGVHEDILTLYTDRIELYHAKLSFPMDTTDRFHEYRIDIRNTDVTITVDTQPAIRGKGAFAFPAHKARNRISIGGGASSSTGEALWDWVSWTDGLTATRLRYPVVTGAEHIIVFKEEGVYAPFPGLSIDPETGFLYTTFAKKTRRTHHKTTNATRGTMGSRDGGRTWSDVPRVPEIARGPHRGPMFKASDGALITIGQNWRRWFPPEREAEFKRKYRITRPGTYKPNWFAFTSGGYVRRSADGGKTWSRADIPGLDTYVSCSSPWSLLQLKDGRVLRTFMVLSGAKDSGDVFAAITADGRTAEVARIMGDPDEKLRFTEETLVHETSKGVIWVLTRVEGGDDHLWQGTSRDGGRTWTSRKTNIVGHPPSGFVELRDGRVLLTYGYRHPPYGVRAVLSTDEGLTWDADHFIVLRNDGDSYDLGYPVSTQLADGTIFTIYYFTGRDSITHIAATRWHLPQ